MASLPDTSSNSDPNYDSWRPLLELLRIRHWIKGLFILLPLPFAVASGVDLHPENLILGILGFSLVSSSVYIFNDIQDRHRDQHHPLKCQRPIAAGVIRPMVAFWWGIVVLGIGMTILGLPGILKPYSPEPWLLALIYLGGNGIYTFWARSLAWLDALFLASFFLLRLYLGCTLSQISPSATLLSTGFLLAFSLALGKRYSELISGYDGEYRSSLNQYRQEILVKILILTVACCWGCYLWYCWTSPLISQERWWWSAIVSGFGLYKYMNETIRERSAREPVAMILESIWPRWVIPIWIILVILSIE